MCDGEFCPLPPVKDRADYTPLTYRLMRPFVWPKIDRIECPVSP
jgi:hypothetical protein